MPCSDEHVGAAAGARTPWIIKMTSGGCYDNAEKYTGEVRACTIKPVLVPFPGDVGVSPGKGFFISDVSGCVSVGPLVARTLFCALREGFVCRSEAYPVAFEAN